MFPTDILLLLFLYTIQLNCEKIPNLTIRYYNLYYIEIYSNENNIRITKMKIYIITSFGMHHPRKKKLVIY